MMAKNLSKRNVVHNFLKEFQERLAHFKPNTALAAASGIF